MINPKVQCQPVKEGQNIGTGQNSIKGRWSSIKNTQRTTHTTTTTTAQQVHNKTQHQRTQQQKLKPNCQNKTYKNNNKQTRLINDKR